MNFEDILYDRKAVIRDFVKSHGEDKFYISFSGGKDSTILSTLVDEAIPDNNIPRVFINTGIEYLETVRYVKEAQKKDKRIVILNVGKHITKTLHEVGYPFKSKEHSLKMHYWKTQGNDSKTGKTYHEKEGQHSCPKILRYQFEDEFTLNISNRCCYEFKKKPAREYEKQTGRVPILALRMAEGGERANHVGCVLKDKKGNIIRFKPLNHVSDDWMNWYLEYANITLSKLYYPPYNFKRTGCKGCPFNLQLQKDLDIMEQLLPIDYKQCEYIWKPVYEEYRRIGYRLRKE